MAGQQPAAASLVAVGAEVHLEAGEPRRARRVLEDTTGNIQVSKLALRSGKDAKNAGALAVRKRPSKPHAVRAARLAQRVEERNGEEERPFTLEDGLKRYRDYQARQHQERGHGEMGMWAGEYERAFVEAIWMWWPYPPKKKIPMADDKFGINELIGHYVSMVTKGKRVRKQTASHKQVVRNHFNQMPGWEPLMIADVMGSRNAQEDAPIKERKAKELEAYVLPMSREERHPKPRSKKKGGEGETSDEDGTPRPTIWPVRFAMRVRKTSASRSAPTASEVHLHTVMVVPRSSSPVPLEDLKGWEGHFPCFTSLYRTDALDCEIISMDVKLNMPVETLSLASTLNADLAICADPTFANHLWRCSTKIYSDGKLVWNVALPVPAVEGGSTDDKVQLQLPFAVDLWSEMLEQLGVESAHKSKREANADVARHVSRLSVVQELFALARSTVGEPNRVAIFLWRFSTTRKDTPGKTTWRSVTLPTPDQPMDMTEDEPAFPALPPPTPSLSLGGAIHEPLIVRWALPQMERSTEMDDTPLGVHTTPLDEAYESQPMVELSGREHLVDDPFQPSYCLSFDSGMSTRGALEATEPATIATHLLTEPTSMGLYVYGEVGGGPCMSSTDETYGSQTYAHHPYDLRPVSGEATQGFPSSMPMQMYEHGHGATAMMRHEETETETETEIPLRMTLPSMPILSDDPVRSSVVLPVPTHVR